MTALFRRRNLFVLGLIILAALLRFYRLDTIPPGISTDDAQEGTDAIAVLEGQPQIYFPAGGGREPMLVYLDALVVKILGPTTLALHIPVAVAGVVSILAIYLLTREMFDYRIALLTAALVTLSYWHLNSSRTGQRVILVPLFESLAYYFFWRGWNKTKTLAPTRTGAKWDFAIAGAFLGATIYTYGAARVAPLVVVLFLVAMLFLARDQLRLNGQNLALYALCALIVFAPLGLFFWLNPDAFTQRLREVSSNELGLSALVATFSRNVLPTLGMFTFAGDVQWKSNLPGRPVFDWFSSVFFYLGIGLALVRIRKPEFIFLLLWFCIGLLPGALSDESPHFLRTISALPATYIFFAFALMAEYDLVSKRWNIRVAQIMLAATLIYTGWLTTVDYFGSFANNVDMYHFFYGDLAATVDFLKQNPNERTYLSVEYADLNGTIMRYYEWNQPFGDVRLFNATSGFVLPDRSAFYLVPFTAPASPDTQKFLDRGMLLQKARTGNGLELYRAYQLNAEKIAPKNSLDANLGNEIKLVGYNIDDSPQAGGMLNVAVEARTLDNSKLDLFYKFFAHLVDENGYDWSSDEAIASDPSTWSSDETVITFFHLPIPPDAPPKSYFVEFGFYSPIRGRVPVVDKQGQVAGTTVASAPIRVARGSIVDASQIAIPHRVQDVALHELRLLGYDAGDMHVGESGQITFYWRADTRPSRDYSVLLTVTDVRGQPVVQEDFMIANGAYPTSEWRAGDIVRDSVSLDLPTEMNAGDYTLAVSIADKTAAVTTIHVDALAHQFTIPPIQNPLNAMLGDAIEFLGYDVEANTKPGETFALTLYWSAKKTMAANYTVFTHLLDAQGRVWGQRDRLPLNGDRPTTSWIANEVLADRYRIPVAPDAPAGIYAIEVGMYDAVKSIRVPVFDASGNRVSGDQIVLGKIQVK